MFNEEDIPIVTTSFQDISECTEYFYNEFGKYEQISVTLSKREKKRIRKFLSNSLLMSLALLEHRNKVQSEIDKKEVLNIKKSFFKSYPEDKETNIKKIENKQIELINNTDPPVLEF